MSDDVATIPTVASGADLTEMQWYGSEGGRKCVACQRYRRGDDLFIPPGSASCHRVGGEIMCYAVAPICGACLERQLREESDDER